MLTKNQLLITLRSAFCGVVKHFCSGFQIQLKANGRLTVTGGRFWDICIKNIEAFVHIRAIGSRTIPEQRRLNIFFPSQSIQTKLTIGRTIVLCASF